MIDLDKVEGLFDIGFVFPSERKILSFLGKFYGVPFQDSKKWEKLLFDFFRENPFVCYLVIRRISKYSDLEIENVSKEFSENLVPSGVCMIDTNEIFKLFCKIYEESKMDKNRLKLYLKNFFFVSYCFRKAQVKVIDNNDSSFLEFQSKIINQQAELFFEGEKDSFFQNTFLICVDSNIDFDSTKFFDIANKEFNEVVKRKSLGIQNGNGQRRNPIDSRLRHEVFKRDNYRCLECGATKNDRRLEVDHILPVIQGGSDELSNLQTLCYRCNFVKFNKKFVAGN